MAVDFIVLAKQNLGQFIGPDQASNEIDVFLKEVNIFEKPLNDPKKAKKLSEHLVSKGGVYTFVGRTLSVIAVRESITQMNL